tara:strand:- start:1772 stop:2542 length:771 start_codon:yes stop_codon:yes gene_type:complete
MSKIYRKILRVAFVRNWVSIIRAIWFMRIKRVEIKAFEAGEEVHEPTIFSNKRRIIKNKDNPHPSAGYILGVDRNQACSKSDLLINPIRSIHRVNKNFPKLKILSIGPRTEGEILNLLSHGFKKENIKALDLISYSPWIDVGDMHNMPFEDNSFDIVICGWVIAYSNEKLKAASEITRVLKNNGIASIGVSYSPRTNEEIEKERGYLIASPDRITSTSQLLNLFDLNLKTVFFSNDVEEDQVNNHVQIVSTFSIQK